MVGPEGLERQRPTVFDLPIMRSRHSISTLRFAVAAGGLSKSSLASRSRTSSTGSWLIFARRNRMSLPGPSWCPQPGRHLPRCLFSQEANSQTHISKNATEKPTARATAGSRSGMDGYELRDHLSQQRLRPTGGYFENFYSSVGSISEEIDFQQAVYLSYTWCNA